MAIDGVGSSQQTQTRRAEEAPQVKPADAPAKTSAPASPEGTAAPERSAELQHGGRERAAGAEAAERDRRMTQNEQLGDVVAKRGLKTNQDLINAGFADGKNFEGAQKKLADLGQNIHALTEDRNSAVDVPGTEGSKLSQAAHQAVGSSNFQVDPSRFTDGHVSRDDVDHAKTNLEAARTQTEVASKQALQNGAPRELAMDATLKQQRAFNLYEQASKQFLNDQPESVRKAGMARLGRERAEHDSEIARHQALASTRS